MTRQIIIILALLLLYGCGDSYDKKYFDFNKNDIEHFSSFKSNDTIFYKSLSNDIDTILILDIISDHQTKGDGLLGPQPYNRRVVEIKHLPIDKWHGTTWDDKAPPKTNYQILFWLSKDPIEKETTYSFSFKDFCTNFDTIIGEFHTDTVTLNSKTISNYYILKHSYPERVIDSTNIEIIYWTDKEGLVAYKNKGGQIWTKQSRR